jgi:hypothetical protein
MLKIFQYNNGNGTVELNTPEIILIKEFSELMKDERNICADDKTGLYRLRAFREFTYIYLALDWQSPYADFPEQERHTMALHDASLTDEEFNNPEFRAACRKFKSIQDSTRSIRLLHAAQETVDKFMDYFHNIDPEERDVQTGKPIFKVKDIMAEVSSLSKVLDELNTLESMVKKELAETSSVRGDYEDGYLPNF